VWAPALVGWVGGAGWNVTFRDRNRPLPATGWYPLTPHDRYVPTWHAPDQHQRWLNEHVRDDPRRPRDYRPQGLTIVPQDRFDHRGRVNVARTPIVTAPPVLAHNVQAGTPPTAPARPDWQNRPDRPDRPDRFDRNHDRDGDGVRDGNRGTVGIARLEGRERRIGTERVERDGFARQRPGQVLTAPPVAQAPGLVPQPAPAQGLPVTSPTPHLPSQPLSTVTSPTPHQSPQPLSSDSPTIQQPQALPPAGVPGGWRRDRIERDRIDRGERRDERREQQEEWRRNRQPVQSVQPIQSVQPQPQPQPQLQPQPQPQPVVPAPAPQPRIERPQPRFERPEPRIERAEARIERPAPPMMPAPQPVQAAPRPAPAPAPAKSEERRQHGDERKNKQNDR